MLTKRTKKPRSPRLRVKVPPSLRPLIPLQEIPKDPNLAKLSSLERAALRASPPGLSPEKQQEYMRLMLKLLEDGVHFPKGKAKWAFTEPEWYEFQGKLSTESRGRSKVMIPDELQPYLNLLHDADATCAASDLDHGGLRSPEILAAYALAAECLDNIIHKSPHMAHLLAPPLSYAADGKPFADPLNAPRLHGAVPWVSRHKLSNLQNLTRGFLLSAFTERLKSVEPAT